MSTPPTPNAGAQWKSTSAADSRQGSGPRASNLALMMDAPATPHPANMRDVLTFGETMLRFSPPGHQRLAQAAPRLAEIVECRFFAGYGEEDTAAALGVSLRTVQRDWLKARAWLFRELSGAV